LNLFLYKLTFAPILVAMATLAGRKWGDSAAGLVAGFPIVAGPILFFYGLEQGPVFATNAALATLLGIFSLSVFVLAYTWRAWSGGSPLSAVILGWVAFAFCTIIINRILFGPSGNIQIGLGKALGWAVLSLFLAVRTLPPAGELRPRGLPSHWDLPLRMGAAAALVWGLTHFAEAIGPRLGGLLTPFPVASTVLAVFAHRQGGSEAARAVLKGMLLALNAFAVFCAVLVLALPRTGLIPSFAYGLAAALAVQAAMVGLRRLKR
jgi:hypothetical protein